MTNKKSISRLVVVGILLVCSFTSFAQKKSIKKISQLPISEQFDYMYKKSSTYEEYKVVRKDWFYMLKKNVTDSIKSSQKQLIQSKNTIEEQRARIDKTNSELKEYKEKIDSLSDQKESIPFFGIPLKKSVYNIIMFAIIATLAGLLGLYIYRFSKSNQVTKKYKKELLDLEEEFESHRAKALEREQKVRRQLQDLINERGI